MNKQDYLTSIEEQIVISAQENFPEWQEAENLFVSSNMAAVREVLSSNIGGDKFFDRFLKNFEFCESFDSHHVFYILKDEMLAYKKIEEYESDYGKEKIEKMISQKCVDKGWEESLKIIEWNINKIKKFGSDRPYVEPSGDNRYRVNESIKLWVMNRSWEGEPGEGSVIGIVDEIERVVLHIEGLNQEYVRYDNKLYKVYDRFEFSRLLTLARCGEIEFFSNVHYSPDYLNDIVPKDFICPE